MERRILLLKLAQMGAMEHYITITTRGLGEELKISQQSASLYLKNLESEDMIERRMRRSGSSIRITKSGVDLLMSLFNDLKGLFEDEREIEVKGIISEGLGEGAYYLSQKGYVDQLRELFSFEPYPGTLNIELSAIDAPLLDLLRRGPGIEVKGFSSGKRTFGSCLCYPCTVNGKNGVIMVPKRTLHVNTLEIISDEKLRDILSLENKDEILLRVNYPPGPRSDQPEKV